MYQEGRVLFCCKCSHLLCWDWVPLCAFVRWHCWECGHHFLWLGSYLRFLWLTSSMGRKTFQLTASARRKRVIYKNFQSLIELPQQRLFDKLLGPCREGNGRETEADHLSKLSALWHYSRRWYTQPSSFEAYSCAASGVDMDINHSQWFCMKWHWHKQ